MKKTRKVVICISLLLGISFFINASFIDHLSGGVFGRVYFGNTGEWVVLDPRFSEYYDLDASFGLYIRYSLSSFFGVEGGIFTWNGEYQTEFIFVVDRHSGIVDYDLETFSLNSVSPYISIFIKPVKPVFAAIGKYFTGIRALKNYFFIRGGVEIPVIRRKRPVHLMIFGDYYLNENDGENFWSLNIGIQIN
ncbi:MAG: hypothetical protein ABFR36_09620 [Acidobacteriota bacterium]